MTDRWWRIIAAYVVGFPLLVAGDLFLLTATAASNTLAFAVFFAVNTVFLAVWVTSTVALQYDRRIVHDEVGWEPSRVYFTMFFPLIGVLVGSVYLLRRHLLVGVP